ncbi:MAG: flavin reductase family protein [Trueperaceae bacterium]
MVETTATTSFAIADLHGRHAYRLLTSLVVPRPIAWISTLAADGTPNLAPFSFFNIVSGRPLMVMFSSGRRAPGEPKDSLANAVATGEFVVNLADEALAEQVNLTSATVGPNVNEFEAFGVRPAPSIDVKPPRVASAKAALEARVAQVIPIEGSTSTMVLGHVLRVHVSEDLLGPDGLADATRLAPIARLGRDEYATLGRVFSLARPD